MGISYWLSDMVKKIEDLEILRSAEEIADLLWREVSGWKHFEKDTIGKQMVRSADSIGANLAEAFGRFHYGERIRHIYFSRGSLFETKYWINRCRKRGLLDEELSGDLVDRLSNLAHKINGFVKFLKAQRKETASIRESSVDYAAAPEEEMTEEADVFSASDLAQLTGNQ